MKPILLVVDDVPELREWLGAIIGERFPQFQIRLAGSAVEFHLAIDRDRPALVLFDEVLGPGEDLASLLDVVSERGIRVALMTGMDPAHRNAANLPSIVTRRMIKPNWGTGEGTEAFLAELGAVIALTTPA